MYYSTFHCFVNGIQFMYNINISYVGTLMNVIVEKPQSCRTKHFLKDIILLYSNLVRSGQYVLILDYVCKCFTI